jgi:integrase
MATGSLRSISGSWYLDISTGRRLPSGGYERIRRRAKGRTKAQARAELLSELDKLDRAEREGKAIDNALPLPSLLSAYAYHLSQTIGKKSTLHAYRIRIKHVGAELAVGGVETCDQLNQASAREAAARIAEAMSTNTANKSLALVKRACEYGVDTGLLASNPVKGVRGLKTVRKKLRRALLEAEFEALAREASPTYRPIWTAFYATGMRHDELVRLRVADLDLARGELHVREREGETIKTEAAGRVVPISADLAAILRRQAQGKAQGDYLFGTAGGKPRSNNMLREFRRHMVRALVRLGWSRDSAAVEAKTLDIHSLRYTFITLAIGNGADPKSVQAVVGHKDVQTTMRIYAQYRHEGIKAAIDAIRLPAVVKSSSNPEHETVEENAQGVEE